ncbi:MAG TPA: SOS response-associated peptidase [Actinomycetes bacterium]|jgi:putative SOS response-associated peptidase YedK|nr:SOS response-associated peptidase [Actinomycetes bacterium]
MCGRFTSTAQLSLLAERFHADPVGVEGHRPSWNVTPASDVLVVAASSDGARRLRALHWGLLPKWAKDPSARNQMINLRAETARSKPTFARLLARKRCIIPVDGFYEWQDMGKGQKKQPIYVTARDPQPLALAGLWESWHDKPASGDAGDQPQDTGERELWTCTILTTTPNKLMASIHHRMPVILPPETWDSWLDPANTDAEALAALLVPAPDDLLVCWPVDPAVNSPRSNGPELTRPLEGHEPRTAAPS